MKNFIGILIFLMASSSFGVGINDLDNGGCDIPSKEELACGVFICSVGVAVPAATSECLKIFKKWAIYLATLGPFQSPARCKSRDMNCNTSSTHAKMSYESCAEDGDLTYEGRAYCMTQVVETECYTQPDPNISETIAECIERVSKPAQDLSGNEGGGDR